MRAFAASLPMVLDARAAERMATTRGLAGTWRGSSSVPERAYRPGRLARYDKTAGMR